jgi:glycosyltransferase involved in cell wall biosynthesis
MRVLLITKPLIPPWNDSGKIVPRELVRSASGRHELHVLVTSESESDWPESVCAHKAYAGAGSYRPGLSQQLRLMYFAWSLRKRVDIFHFFFQPHRPASRAARTLTGLSGVRSVHTVLSAPKETENASRLLFADRTVTLSGSTARLFAQSGQPAPLVIPPALADMDRVGEARARNAGDAARVEGSFLLYPGDYEFSGGHEFLLDVWSDEPQLPILVMTGRDKTPRAQSARNRLEGLVASRGLSGRVRLLGTVADLAGLVAASAGVVFPAESLYGKTDLPLVILEAWREGKPVVVSDLAPLAEAVAGGGHVLPLDAESWRHTLASLPEEGAGLAAAGYRHLCDRYSAAHAMAEYEKLYDELESR